MRGFAICGALALLGLATPDMSFAKTSAQIRRDHEIIRQMNQRELARVSRRDARYAAQRRASRDARDDYAWRRAAYERDMDDYRWQRRQYNARMAQWRRAVAACNAGVRSACAR